MIQPMNIFCSQWQENAIASAFGGIMRLVSPTQTRPKQAVRFDSWYWNAAGKIHCRTLSSVLL